MGKLFGFLAKVILSFVTVAAGLVALVVWLEDKGVLKEDFHASFGPVEIAVGKSAERAEDEDDDVEEDLA